MGVYWLFRRTLLSVHFWPSLSILHFAFHLRPIPFRTKIYKNQTWNTSPNEEIMNLENLLMSWWLGAIMIMQPETRKLQYVCYHQADIGMRSHRLLRLDDDKSVTNCYQTCCKLRTACRLDASCFIKASCNLRVSRSLGLRGQFRTDS